MPQHFRIHEQARPHFVTSTIVHWIPVFSRDDYFRVLVDSLTYCCEHKGLQVHGYIIMPHHFHAILSQVDARLSDVLRDLKKHTSKEIARKLEEDGRRVWLTAMRRSSGNADGVRVWEEDFHPEEIRTQPFFQQKLDYIHANPERAGYLKDPCAWKYSSAGFYYHDGPSIVPIMLVDW